MNEQRNTTKILKNTLFLNISTLVTRGLGLLTSILIARYLGASDFGKYTFAVNFTGLFIVLMDMGLNFVTVREVAKDRSLGRKYLGHSLIIRSFSFVIVFLVIVVSVNAMSYPASTRMAVFIFGFYALLKIFGTSFNSIFLSFERMEYITLTEVFLAAITLSGVVVTIYLHCDLNGLLWAYPTAIIIYLLFTFELTKIKFFKPDFRFDSGFARRFISVSFHFVLAGIFLTIMTRIDTVMLKTMKGDIATGYYGVGRTLMSALLFIPANFNAVFYPLYSKLFHSDDNSLKSYYEKSFFFLMILALPMAVGNTILADKIILFFYGEEFLPAVFPFQILIWALAVQFLYSNVNILLLAVGKQKTIAWIAFVCMIFNVVSNIMLIPKYSYVGASIATLVTYCVLFLIVFYIASSEIHFIKSGKKILKLILCAAIMGAFVYNIKDMNLFIVIFLAMGIYGLGLVLFKVVTKNDYNLFRHAFKKP